MILAMVATITPNSGSSSSSSSSSKSVDDLLKELNEHLVKVKASLKEQSIKLEEVATVKGMSLLEIKYRGGSLKQHEYLVQDLIRQRVMLEKLRPVENKVKYQIDKLIRSASLTSTATTTAQDMDPYNYRPNPTLLTMEEEEEEGVTGEIATDGVYKPPKIVPVPYDGDDGDLERRGGNSKQDRDQERLLQKARRSRMLKELEQEFMETPEELGQGGGGGEEMLGGRRVDQAWEMKERRRIQYEEDNFTRLTLSKKDKKANKPRFRKMDDDFQDLKNFSANISLLKKSPGPKKAGGSGLIDRAMKMGSLQPSPITKGKFKKATKKVQKAIKKRNKR